MAPAITGRTRVNALIGSPIAQVLAPGWLTERMREDPSELTSQMVVADVITDPVPTKLLAEAAKRGCATRDGTHMLDGQIDLLLSFMLGTR